MQANAVQSDAADRWVLVDKVRKFILQRLLAFHRVPVEDLEEMMQEAVIAVFEGLERYDPERGALTTFVGHLMKGAVSNYRRRDRLYGPSNLQTAKRVRLQLAADDDDQGVFLLGGSEDDVLESIDVSRRCRQVALAMPRLTHRERCAIAMWQHDTSGAAIGEHIGVSRERVRQLREAGLRRLRKTVGA